MASIAWARNNHLEDCKTMQQGYFSYFIHVLYPHKDFFIKQKLRKQQLN